MKLTWFLKKRKEKKVKMNEKNLDDSKERKKV